MTAIPVIVQLLHVLASSVWLGMFVFAYAGLYPRIDDERAAWAATVLFGPVNSLSIGLLAVSVVTGVLRGTLLGPIDSLAVLTEGVYGITWLTGLAGTVGLLIVETMVLRSRIRHVRLGDGRLDSLRGPAALETVLAMGVVATMVLLRFGL